MTELLDIAEKVVSSAKSGEEVEAYVSWARETSVRAYKGEVEQLSSAESSGIGVRVVTGNRVGFAYSGSLDGDSLRETLENARDNATFATPDEYAALAAPDGVTPATLELWSDSLVDVSLQDKIALAQALEAATLAADPRVRLVPGADYADVATESALVSTTGIRNSARRTACWLMVEASAGDGAGAQTAYSVGTGRSPKELDVHALAVEAAHRATRLLGARKTPSTRLAVVFEPRVTGSLLSLLGGALSGEAVAKGRSLFAGRLDEIIASELVTLVDDPTDPDSPGASIFDAEGLACRRNVLIDKGTLRTFLYDSYSGRRAGLPSTGSAVRGGYRSGPSVGARALALDPGVQSPEELIASTHNGLLVQAITGVHSGVNPVSGDFSVGAEGLLIRDGQLGEPVREVTIASTVQRMLVGITGVGSDIRWLPGGSAGMSLAIDEMRLSGT